MNSGPQRVLKIGGVSSQVPRAHAQYAAALYESQWARSATRKAKKPEPTHQAKLVMWHLTKRVPLTFAAIPENEIATACKKFGLSLETWRRQERAFG